MAATAPDDDIVEIRTTFPDRAAARACAGRLVAARLAACGQVDGPLASTYRWEGRIESAEEWRCTCKTTAARSAACIDAIVATHPYVNPELLVVRVAAAPAYAAWVRAAVGTVADDAPGTG